MVEQIRGAVDALKAAARDLDTLQVDGRGAAELFEVVTEGERTCVSMKAFLARRIDETRVWQEGGHRSAAHWLAEASGETVGAAARTLETARALAARGPRPSTTIGVSWCTRPTRTSTE